jgi:hypothetical protein
MFLMIVSAAILVTNIVLIMNVKNLSEMLSLLKREQTSPRKKDMTEDLSAQLMQRFIDMNNAGKNLVEKTK